MTTDYAHPIQTRRAEALTLEHRISDLVNPAYGLTPRRHRPHVENRPTPNAL